MEKLAGLHGIYLRTGCFCNPGACAWHLGLTADQLRANFNAGHVCWDDSDIIDGWQVLLFLVVLDPFLVFRAIVLHLCSSSCVPALTVVTSAGKRLVLMAGKPLVSQAYVEAFCLCSVTFCFSV